MAGGLTGGAAGAVVGLAGRVVLPPTEDRTRLTAWLVGGAVLMALAAMELVKGDRWLPQLSLQTNRAWLTRPPTEWAVRAGGFLGVGGFSRIGFATWYVVPAVAFLSRSAAVGALCFGAYGLARLALSLLLFDSRGDPIRRPSSGRALWLRDNALLHLISGMMTVIVGVALVAGSGGPS